MKPYELLDAIGAVKDPYLLEAEEREVFLNESRNRPRNGIRTSRVLLLSAILLLLAVLGGVALYIGWHMPDQGEPYHGDLVVVTEENQYDLTDPVNTETVQPEETYSDQWFTDQATEILKTVGQWETDTHTVTVTRQKNQHWDREEVLVSFFGQQESSQEVKFDGATGFLIGVTAFDRFRESGEEPMQEEDALRIAQEYYDALPYADGYEFDYIEKYDDDTWSFHFDRPIHVTLWGEEQILHSNYEEVRIILDPRTGAFQMSNCFYVPLLDDHTDQMDPITEQQAVDIAVEAGVFSQSQDQYTVTAQLGICLPKPGELSQWLNTENAEYQSYKAYGITRLAWILTYQGEMDGFSDCYQICVDLYTGELLSIDATK